jgi:hypothetical protein
MQMTDKLILGHNQFFGVNHLSSARGIATEQYFSSTENVISLVRVAYRAGVTGLMLSTHERARALAEALRKDSELSSGLHLHILLPYMAKYVRTANERGLISMLEEMLKQATWAERMAIGLKAGIGVVKKDLLAILAALIKIELLPFKGLNVQSVFLHNSLTDMLAALRAREVVQFFIRNIEEEHGACPAFCTLSAGLTMSYFRDIGLESPVIMAPFNPVGFQMNPSRERCEQLLREYPCHMVAMSVLAAGYVKPADAASYLSSLAGIDSIIFGASSPGHVAELSTALGAVAHQTVTP